MEKWSVDELCLWLCEIGIKEEIIKLFREEEFDGDSIHSVSDVDALVKLLPELKRGPADKIIRARNALANTPLLNNIPVSEVRPFGSSSNGQTYTHGSVLAENGVKLEESGPDLQNLLKPAHEFKSNPSGEVVKFVKETLRFITACLNSRVNGVIHFGIEDKTAKVLGCKLSCLPEGYKDKLEEKISNCFELKSQQIVRGCMSHIKFIHVSNAEEPSFVMEVEVEPNSESCKKRYFEINTQKIDMELNGKDYDKMSILVRRGSNSVAIPRKEIKEFQDKTLHDNIKRRKMAEQSDADLLSLKAKSLENILKQESIIDDSTFPVLVLDKPNSGIDEQDLHFICGIRWRVVFDFDNKGRLHRQYKSDGFFTTKQSPESLFIDLTTLERISSEPTTCWISANGNDETQDDSYSSIMWKKKRRAGIISTILQIRDLSLGRAFIVFLFFDDNEGLISEIYNKFVECYLENQLLYIAETVSALKFLHEKLSPDNIKPYIHGIIGLPWSHVAGIFNSVSGEPKSNCEVPSSSSAPIALNRNDYAHLEILSINECKDVELQTISDDQNLEKKCEFYKGHTVSWVNIALSEERFAPDDRHVVKRDLYDDLKKKVQYCLDRKNTPTLVDSVTVYYQPGAGASTLTRHVLWSFRKDYKCAVVSNISSNDTSNNTCSQIRKLYQHGDEKVAEEKRKPVLVLLDISDEGLFQSLSEDLAYVSPRPTMLFCVLIRCCRTVSLQRTNFSRNLNLKQKLSPEEADCFEKLLTRTQTQLQSGAKQEYKLEVMLAFLIFQNPQNPYIKECVKNYLGSSDLKVWERPILKYIALMNTYLNDEPDESLPIACFDSIVPEHFTFGLKKSNTFNQESPDRKWWYTLSTTFWLFCIKVSKYSLGTIGSFKIVHPLLANEILNQMLTLENQKLSDVVLEFLRSPIFKSRQSKSINSVIDMTGNMFKQRKQCDGGEKPKFSKIIVALMAEENNNLAALSVMKEAFEVLTKGEQKDAILVQQMARICMKSDPKNLDEAEKYANLALKLQKKNSYLLDTMGQVFKARLNDFRTYEVDGRPLSIEKCKEAIRLARSASDNFRWSVEKNQNEGTINYYGYVGEIEVYRKLLELLRCISLFSDEDGKTKLLRFLKEQNYVPDECRDNWEEYNDFLKQLPQSIENALTGILDCLTLLTSKDGQHATHSPSNPKKDLLSQVIDHRRFFEELLWKMQPLENLTDPRAKCEWNRAKVKEMGGLHFSSIFMLEHNKIGLEKLIEMEVLLRENVDNHRGPINEFDHKTSMLVSMAIGLFDTGKPRQRPNITPAYICDLCKTCKAIGIGSSKAANLFLSMLLWPRKDLKASYNHNQYMQILTELKVEDQKTTKRGNSFRSRVAEYQASGHRAPAYKMATHFFLGKGEGFSAIVHQNRLNQKSDSTKFRADKQRAEFWNSPIVNITLAKVEGVCRGGQILAFNDIKIGQDFRIPVKIAFPTSSVNEERVEFYLGFSWGGPIAYHVQPTSTRLTRDLSFHRSTKSYYEEEEHDVAADKTELTFEDYLRELNRLQYKINKSQKEEAKGKWSKKLEELKQRYNEQMEARDFDPDD